MAMDAPSEPQLTDYLRAISRRRWVVAVTVALIVGAAVLFTFLQTPRYTATADVLLEPDNLTGLLSPGTAQSLTPDDVQTQIQLFHSAQITADVRKKLGSAPGVSVSAVSTTDVVQVQAVSTSAAFAARTANTYAQAYVDDRVNQQVDAISKATQDFQTKITNLGDQIKLLDLQIAGTGPSSPGNATLTAQRDSLAAQEGALTTQLDQLQINSSLVTGNSRIITPASPPANPSSPRIKVYIVAAVVIGLALGLGLALVVDYMDDSITTKEEAERACDPFPVIGMVSDFTATREADHETVVSLSAPASHAAESYRSLRTSVQFMGIEREISTLVVTSAMAREGKTVTVANLGVALARAGKKVVLLDCDLRRPRLHELFDMSNSIGFTSVLLDEVRLDDAIVDVPACENLRLLPSGPLPPNPSELLSGSRVVDVLAQLKAGADIVLIDTPPVVPVTDAAAFSTRVDAVVLVARARLTRGKILRRCTEILRQVGAPVIGAAFVGVPSGSGYEYYYYYHHDRANGATQRRFRSKKSVLVSSADD